MENSIKTQKKTSGVITTISGRSDQRISELDILRRAYEIYMENSTNFSDDLWNILRGEFPVEKSGT